MLAKVSRAPKWWFLLYLLNNNTKNMEHLVLPHTDNNHSEFIVNPPISLWKNLRIYPFLTQENKEVKHLKLPSWYIGRARL